MHQGPENHCPKVRVTASFCILYILTPSLFVCFFFFELFGGSIPTSSADASENTKAAIYCQLLCCTPYRYIFKPFHLHTCGWVPRADTVADVYTFWRGAVDGKHTLMWGGELREGEQQASLVVIQSLTIDYNVAFPLQTRLIEIGRGTVKKINNIT